MQSCLEFVCLVPSLPSSVVGRKTGRHVHGRFWQRVEPDLSEAVYLSSLAIGADISSIRTSAHIPRIWVPYPLSVLCRTFSVALNPKPALPKTLNQKTHHWVSFHRSESCARQDQYWRRTQQGSITWGVEAKGEVRVLSQVPGLCSERGVGCVPCAERTFAGSGSTIAG